MNKKVLSRICAAAVVLTLASTSLLGGTMAKYTGAATATDSARVAKFDYTVKQNEVSSGSLPENMVMYNPDKQPKTKIDIFGTSANDTGVLGTFDKDDAGTKLIAPGMEGYFSFLLSNSSEVALKATFEDLNYVNDSEVPLIFYFNGGYYSDIYDKIYEAQAGDEETALLSCATYLSNAVIGGGISVEALLGAYSTLEELKGFVENNPMLIPAGAYDAWEASYSGGTASEEEAKALADAAVANMVFYRHEGDATGVKLTGGIKHGTRSMMDALNNFKTMNVDPSQNTVGGILRNGAAFMAPYTGTLQNINYAEVRVNWFWAFDADAVNDVVVYDVDNVENNITDTIDTALATAKKNNGTPKNITVSMTPVITVDQIDTFSADQIVVNKLPDNVKQTWAVGVTPNYWLPQVDGND